MIQMQITLPENTMGAIRAEAEKYGITPNVIARMRLCMLFSECGDGATKKSYILTLEKWREIEAYIKVKHPGTPIEIFAAKAIFSEMKKHGLNLAEKDEFKGLLGK